MARLPQPGSDKGQWGVILNDCSFAGIKADGTLKDNSVTATTIANGSITEQQLDSDVRSKAGRDSGAKWSAVVNNRLLLLLVATKLRRKRHWVSQKVDVGLDNVRQHRSKMRLRQMRPCKTISGCRQYTDEYCGIVTGGERYCRRYGVFAR